MQTTRLHISGLTPSISASDLKQRFSTFGDVRDVDGVGKLDGVGRPRKFAYLTLETTQPKLARCMNLLSGSTWKGAKLRIGEAKPDYTAQHERELNPPPPAPRPKLSAEARRRARLKFRLRARRLLRGTQGKQLKDMSIITLETVSKHKGWRRTPLNHLVRPMRMRPLRPLPSLRSKQLPSKMKPKKKLDKRKFKLTRARCTVIDPVRYGAVHLKDGDGLLGAEVVAAGRDEEAHVVVGPVREQVVIEKPDEKPSRSPTPTPSIPSTIVSERVPVSATPGPGHNPLSPVLQHQEEAPSLVHEKSSALALLGGMFGQGEWGGQESVSGDEMETMEVEVEGEGEAGYEVVPMVADEVASNAEVEENEEDEVENKIPTEDLNEQEDEQPTDETNNDEQDEPQSPVKHSSLKDMFKPQEQSTGFSLGLDIELDPDAESFLPASISVLPPSEPVLAPASIATEKRAHTIQFTPDSSAPLFFPGGKNDILRVIGEKGWEWPHPGTSEEIRAKWDKNKAELTREYTRRHREAVKKRKRGGTKGDEA